MLHNTCEVADRQTQPEIQGGGGGGRGPILILELETETCEY